MRLFLATLAIAGTMTAAQAQQADDRYPSWSNRMQGHVKAREWRWKADRRRPRTPGEVIGGRPAGCPSRAWCGCYLAKLMGIADRALWVARNWAHVGSHVAHPTPGVIVVWRHHVGKVTAVDGNRIRVLSGNDGHRVRDRWRSTAGVIAYRSRS